jgi:hypothetical protein
LFQVVNLVANFDLIELTTRLPYLNPFGPTKLIGWRALPIASMVAVIVLTTAIVPPGLSRRWFWSPSGFSETSLLRVTTFQAPHRMASQIGS